MSLSFVKVVAIEKLLLFTFILDLLGGASPIGKGIRLVASPLFIGELCYSEA